MMLDYLPELMTQRGIALFTIAALPVTAFLAWFLTGQVIKQLKASAILDHPNERSSHDMPTPRGGGWGILAVLFPSWTLILGFGGLPIETFWLLTAAALLAWVSWLDDLRTIPARYRFGVQFVSVMMGLFALTPFGPVTQGLLPLWLDRLVLGFAWLWFINLYNFMDGIDGLAGAETTTIGIGVAAVILISPTMDEGWPTGALIAISMAGASLGFLWWNWSPARVFMGDVGSIPIGFLIGWLLFCLAAQGHLIAAVIIPLYFCADASLTLIRRVATGSKPWQPHREHFYQRATQNGLSHANTVIAICIGNVALIGCALLSVFFDMWALIPAAITTLLMLTYLSRHHGVDGPPTRI